MNIIENDFGLPKISEELEKEEFEYRNKYRNIYIRLIIRCQNMTEEELSGYNEKHHIIPKCLGGKNNKDNLVLMPVRYHIMAHVLLFQSFPENTKLGFALNCMISGSGKERKDCIESKFSTRFIASLKENSVKAISGENNPRYGKHWNEEVKLKLSIAAKNRSPESRKNIAEGRRGIPVSEETRKKISESRKGIFPSEETKIKLKLLARKGSENNNSNSVISPEGKIFGSIIEASKFYNIPYSTLSKWLSGEVSSHGWKYANKKTDYSTRNMDKSSKKVKSPDGVVYESIKTASNSEGISYTTMRYWLSGRVKNTHGWSYYNENDKSQSD